MAYRANPFLERMSERTTSDQEFVRLFSPKILERLADDAFLGGIHIFRSPPGGGKTTLLRAFTPTALRAFWNAARVSKMNEAYSGLVARQLVHEQDGPQVLGVLLSCSSGYADLPPGADFNREGLFRALFDCRVVLRSLRSLAALLGLGALEQLDLVGLGYDRMGTDLKVIPAVTSALDLMQWAEHRERSVYEHLDSMGTDEDASAVTDVRFEGLLWLQLVRFTIEGKSVAPKRLLMVDDVHKLRRKQRSLLIEEFVELRPTIPVWLAERNIVLGEVLLSQGARERREVREYSLENMWSSVGNRGQHQFIEFAQNILDRRLDAQSVIPPGSFSTYMRSHLQEEDVRDEVRKASNAFRAEVVQLRTKQRYVEWLAKADELVAHENIESVRDLYVTRILLMRDELKRQLTLDLAPLSSDDLEQRDNSQVQSAAELFFHDEWKVPFYYGFERLCILATNNVEELLVLAAALYEGLKAKQARRRPELLLSPHEQEKLLREVAKRRRDFIPKNHTEGRRAQRLLDAVGSFCRERTFLPNAPYAPGVTGIRLSVTEFGKLDSNIQQCVTLKRVLTECVAENLLVARQSAASTARLAGTIFYLNRALCAHFNLPLQMGGWQDVTIETLSEWMERGRTKAQRNLSEIVQ
jgi:hypothetical protein